MEQGLAPNFIPSPFHYKGIYPGSQDLPRSNYNEQTTLEPNYSSFNDRVPFQNFGLETSPKRSPSAPLNVLDHWMAKPPAYASLMSKSSPISHPENVSTPTDTGLLMYHLHQPIFHQFGDTLAGQSPWANGSKPLWPPSHPGPTVWGSQTFVPPYHDGSSYEQHPLQSKSSFLTQPNVSASTQCMPYHTSLQNMDNSKAQSRGSATVKIENPSIKGDDSDDQIDSESELSGSDDDCSSTKSSSSELKGARRKMNAFGPDNFPGIMEPVDTILSQSVYECALMKSSKANGICRKRFTRPEHLRRHMKTVHTDEKDYVCLVPDCERRFSRRDNLDHHYWTHLSPGGKMSKNKKMSFEEIRNILNPKQKQLLQRLKMKLKNQKKKNRIKEKL
ncbi:c2h2 type conidiation transcription factor [Stemphylium lycopersici]|uniref:C2h2 type conidiation transcription factor n=1 Tax=Stemphylium lycopersici TaxID=183478 RepID=A0A364MSY6_STELY|nr:hypothetical protein TW65_99352 [Stemphylium lycopersici]RAQ98755.1 c2h2 type conidiation transcription factor [Stemphylium lycopersici]RAR02001.1 c2h2 type conidiation transcription factor [Stemphylium lycopersici]